MEVIEIFSSDEEDALTNDKTAAKNAAQDVFVLSIPGAWAGTPARSSAKSATSTKKNPPSKQIAEPSKHSSSGSPSRATREKSRTTTSASPKQQKMAPLFADDSDESSDEVEAVPSFDEPRVHKAKTPASRARETPKKQTRNPADEPRAHNTKTPSTPRTKTHPNEHESFSVADRDDDHAIMTM
ncbi:hypothetical protein ONZ45_g16782 [Pleurotus djamor]|nr:hypothetical protein ONZ45_g16782 [Pleurotus djamor]